MFLALKEMRYSKLRYGLIIGIMFLVSYVVFILTGLATGLAQEFSQAVEDWQAEEIVLSKDANQSFAASQLTRKDFDRVTSDEKAPLGLYNGALKDGKDQEDVTVFGTTDEAFLLPKLTKGKVFAEKNEVIISQNLADTGIKVGDQVKVGNYQEKLTVTGIFPATYYTATPVVYTNLATWTSLKYQEQPFAKESVKPLSAIVTKDKNISLKSGDTDLEKMTIPDFILAIPGYEAQGLTLNGMIYFLFVIVIAIVGIFMYVITLQKTSIFGVMKAQGISTGFIAKSIVAQSFIVGVIGVALAFGVASLTSLILPDAMPFAIQLNRWFLYSLVLVAVAILGGLFSIRTVTKVDPISAIGG